MKCFNSGCSFTTPGIVTDEDMYWYGLAKDKGCTSFINASKPASSNELIFRRVYDHVLSNVDGNTFYIINLSSLNRIEIEDTQSDKLEKILMPEALARYDVEIVELALFTQLIGLIVFLNHYKKDFYIINNSKELNSSPFPKRDQFVEFLKKEPRALNLFKFSKFNFHKDISHIKPFDYKLYGWAGHDDLAGHQAYYSMLQTLI